jgi:16S rRNA processing protein RimM
VSNAPHPVRPPAAADDTPARPDDAVEVGRVLGPWGVKGGIKVKPFSSDPQALFSSKRWFVEPPAAAVPAPARAAALPMPRLLRVISAREQGDAVVATTQELGDRDAALALAGARIFVSRASFPTPAADEFYWVDLIGLAVVNREGLALGTVGGLIETGPHCVLRVQPAAGPADAARDAADERLIPFVDAYVDRVDLPARTILVDWPADY